ncbi:hypothetical protein FDP41_008103 [Naegleria fowleri]|uniref:Erythromycin esterase n=1 Tax=Naegleria fowleri TaxID=5763 RepID=A0A6A5BKL2_NAEFO|nr:uncharacterized protein FDP41_008103 [Naegleria fowleri]KAF0973399.1 hypothetical protein FDP41_008103 [Naegleria fowleri]CAG4719647.1 unnamed protein product [Naegleria fowleri]
MSTREVELIRKNWEPVLRDISKLQSLTFYDKLIKAVGNAQIVLIGEASHGTHEFYKHRAEITKRLIEEKGFNCVAAEADFPDCFQLNQYVRNITHGSSSEEALSGFKRFPTWMWRNTPTKEFLEWLCEYNKKFESIKEKVGFYGLDLYSSDRSMHAVLEYLDSTDPEAAMQARKDYECMRNYIENKRSSSFFSKLKKDCQEKVMKVLLDLQSRTRDFFENDKSVSEEDRLFCAVQNALVVKNAEKYYRAMFLDGSWNIRDSHFFETLQEILKYYEKTYERQAKVVIWAHNSHVGDASQTDKINRIGREINIGRLCRENFPLQKVYIIGFSTYTGSVTAADNWNEDPQYKKVNPGMKGSIEELCFRATQHQGVDNFLLLFRDNSATAASSATGASDIVIDKELVEALAKTREERAIGVIYRPHTERASHYFGAKVSKQFDALIHFNVTRAVHPLDTQHEWAKKELEETYPFGL